MNEVLWNLEYAFHLQETADDSTQRGWDTTASMDHDVHRFDNEDDEMVESGGHMSSDGVEQEVQICSGDRLYYDLWFSEIMDPSA